MAHRLYNLLPPPNSPRQLSVAGLHLVHHPPDHNGVLGALPDPLPHPPNALGPLPLQLHRTVHQSIFVKPARQIAVLAPRPPLRLRLRCNRRLRHARHHPDPLSELEVLPVPLQGRGSRAVAPTAGLVYYRFAPAHNPCQGHGRGSAPLPPV